MKLFRVTSFLIGFFITATIVACGEDNGNGSDDPAFPPIESTEGLDTAEEQEGDAEGDEFSGSYLVTMSGLQYSDDCTTDFVITYEFTVDPTVMSEEEIDALLSEGGDPTTFTQTVDQDDGVINFHDLGEQGEDIQGAINQDGSFQAVKGDYTDDTNYRWNVYEGNIDDTFISGTYTATINIDALGPTGSCTATSTFSGEKVSSDVSETSTSETSTEESTTSTATAAPDSSVNDSEDDSSCTI